MDRIHNRIQACRKKYYVTVVTTQANGSDTTVTSNKTGHMVATKDELTDAYGEGYFDPNVGKYFLDLNSLTFTSRTAGNLYVDYVEIYGSRDYVDASVSSVSSSVTTKGAVVVSFTGDKIPAFPEGAVTIEGVECDVTTDITAQTVTLKPKSAITVGDILTVNVNSALLLSEEGVNFTGDTTFNVPVEYGTATASLISDATITSSDSVTVKFDSNVALSNFDEGLVTIEDVECDVTPNISAQTVSLTAKSGRFVPGSTLNVMVNTTVLEETEGIRLADATPDTFEVTVAYGNATAELISDSVIAANESVTVKFTSTEPIANFEDGLVTIEGVECDYTSDTTEKTVTLTPKALLTAGASYTVKVDTELLKTREGNILSGPSTFDFSVIPLSVFDVKLDKTPMPDETVSVIYEYSGVNGQGAHTYQWQTAATADAPDGEWTNIGTGQTCTFDYSLNHGDYVRVIMTPYDELGNQGYAVTTEPVMYKIAPSEDEDGVAYRKYYINDDYNEAGNVGKWKVGTTSATNQTITVEQETLSENGGNVGALKFYGNNAAKTTPEQPYMINEFDKVEFIEGSKLVIEARVKATGGLEESTLKEGSFVNLAFNRPNDPKYLADNNQSNYRGWEGGTLFQYRNVPEGIPNLAAGTGLRYKSNDYATTEFLAGDYTNEWVNVKVVMDGTDALAQKYKIYILDDNGEVLAQAEGSLKEHTQHTYDMEYFVDKGTLNTSKTKHEDIRSFSFVLRYFSEAVYVDYFKFYELRPVETATVDMTSGSLIRPSDSVTVKFTGSNAIKNFAEGLVTIDGVETVMTQDLVNQTVTVTPVEKLTPGQSYTVNIDKKLLASSEGFILEGTDTFNFNVGIVNVYDVITTGRTVPGTEMGIYYRYADSVADEGTHLYQWQKSVDGITWEDIIGQTNDTYTVTQDIFDNKNYVRIVMTPYDVNGTAGAEIAAEMVIPETTPVLENVTPNASILFPEMYIGPKYDYIDPNGDKIVTKDVQWYVSDSAGGPWTAYSTDEYYYITEDDLNKYFKYEIKITNDGPLLNETALYESTVTGPVVKVEETTNLLVNPGFERGDLGGWKQDYGIIEIAGTEGARTGNYGVHLKPREGLNDSWAQSVQGVVAGKRYVLSGYVKTSSPDMPSVTNFWPYTWGGHLSRVEGEDYSYLVGNNWIQATSAFTSNDGQATVDFVSFHTMDADCYLDDLYFGEVLIKDIETFTPDATGIPVEGTVKLSVTSGKIFNQVGTTHGLSNEKVVVRVPEGVSGITQDGNDLVIDNTAVAGTYVCEVYCEPSYNAPAQEIFQKFVTVTLLPNNDTSPKARNIKVSGEFKAGRKLTGSYDFYQIEGKTDASTYNWMYSDTFDGDYAPIAGATGLTYTLESQYADKFIKFAVNPATTDGLVGTQTLSNAVTMPRPPFVTDASVKGEGKVGGSVEAVYTYNDYNSYNNAKDEEGATTYQWYSSDYADGGFTPIAGATSKTYTFTENEIDKYVKVEIKPVSKIAPTDGTPVMSSAFFGPTAPIATNVAITKSGTTLTGSYNYSHTHGARETDSVYEWKVNGVLVSNSISYTINFEGTKYVEFSVTPVGDTNPSTGKTYSYGVNMAGILSSGSTGAGGGGGTGGGGGGGAAGSTGVTNINDMKIPEKEVQQPEQTQPKSDLSGHWGEAYVKEMEARGVMKADEKGNYDPDRTVSRSEMISYLFDALKLEEAEYNAEFSDVNALDSYAGKLQAMINNGTIALYHEFRPNDGISREEMCKILFVSLQNAGKLTKAETNVLDAFTDKASISDWAIDYVNTIYSNKIMIGTSDTTFAPKENITRAQVATMLVRILKVIEG